MHERMSRQAKPGVITTCVFALVATVISFPLRGFAFLFSWPLGLFGLDYPMVDTLGPFTPALCVAIVSLGTWQLAARFTESIWVIVVAQIIVVLLYLALGVVLSLTPVLTPFRIGGLMHNKPAAGSAEIRLRLVRQQSIGVPEPERYA